MHTRTRVLMFAPAVLISAAVTAGRNASPGTELADAMMGAYQAAQTYHARWLLRADEGPGGVSRSEVEIAFDRPGGRLLVRRQTLDGGYGGPGDQGELLVCDGQVIRVARRLNGVSPSVTRIDPDEITYWVIERALAFQPIDLPLLLDESPVQGWLHMAGGGIDAPANEPANGGPLREFRLTSPAGRDGVDARLDDTNFIREATRTQPRSSFVLTSLAVDEPLDGSIFDFDAQSAFLRGED